MNVDNKNIIPKLSRKDAESLAALNVGRRFGKENDHVEFHMFDLAGRHMFSIEDYKEYTYPDVLEDNGTDSSKLTTTIFVDPYKKLSDLGYVTGQYIVVYRLQRAQIIDTLNKIFQISEISPSRTELKVKPNPRFETLFDNDSEAIRRFISQLGSAGFFRDFTLNFGENNNILGVNIIYQEGELGIKLYEPLPLDLEINDKFRIVEDIIEPIEFVVNLGEADLPEFGVPIKGPNFRIDTRLNDSIPSKFKTYNDFIQNTNSSSLYTVLNNLSESIELSIDYTNTSTGSLETGFHFENFTHFGSAEERLKNFKYKLELLELYQRQLDEIGTITGNVSSSSAVSSNKNLIESKISKVKSNFDNYERFLYYEFHPYAWPKVPDFGIGNLQVTGSPLLPESLYLQVGLTDCDVFLKPYNLRPTTSSEAEEWYGSTNELNINYGGQILSASRFDRDNKHSLIRTIPEHIAEREENESYLTFTNMIGHYFDQIWLYVDHITEIRNAHNSFKKGISKDLVYTALSSLGIEAFDQFENEDLFQYIIGTTSDKTGSFGTYQAPPGQIMVTSSLVTCDNGGSSTPKGDITKEVWKRLYHNLPYLLKTKGTERGIKALMNCYGVPETILNIKEYGGPTTDETTYKTFNYEKFSRALAGSSDAEGFFIKAPWAATSSLFTGVVESKPNRSEGKIIFSIGAIKELFNAPFPKTVELTATDLSTHTFTSNYEFVLHEDSGLETAQSLAGAIDAHPLFSASVFVREDLYDPAHEKYNLDIEIIITQHLQGIDGNTEIKGTLFEDTLTPACGNPQQFPEVEFLTKVDFNGGGGINNSTSTTTVIPGKNTCSSKILIQNGIKEDGTGTLINNGLFTDDLEYMDFVTDVANGYTDKDISLYSFESISPSATPLFLGESQCTGTNGFGLFVIECFKADDCANLQPASISSPTTAVQGTSAVGTITIPNAVGGNNSLYDGKTVILTSADGITHTFTLTGGGSVNSIGQDLTNAINANPNFTAINLNQVPQRTGYALEITTVATGSNANTPIQGSALNLGGDAAFMNLVVNGFTGGVDEVIATPDPEPNTPCNATLQIYVEGGLYFDVSATQFTGYITHGTTGDPTIDNYLNQALPQAQNQWTYNSTTQTFEGDPTTMTATPAVYISSTSILQGKYLTPLEIISYLDANCGDVSSISDECYTNYTTFINALNAAGVINENIPGINVNTKWSELKAPDIITHFPASSSCGCDDYTTGTIVTTNVLTQQPTVNPSIPLGQGAQNGNYGKYGAKFFADTVSTTSYDIDQSNTYFGGTNQNDGRLNNIGVWDGTNPWTGGVTDMTPMNQWIGFSRCINVPADGEYLIGLAGDNRIRFAVNGEMLIEKNTSSTSNFNYWWVYKVNLTAGNNTIVLEGKNDGSIASFGCDIVGPFPLGTFNSETDFEDIDNEGITVGGTYYLNLEEAYKNNIIFSSEDELNTGGEFNTQTNECPEGYLYNECTGLCEKTEIETTTGSCDGMVINPEGNGSFTTSADFVDYFTDINNGFYGQNIDDYYFESDEPLPWGTFVADQCTGSNGLPIRRVIGFRKDQSVIPVDNTLYTNYQTFINQLNADGHGVSENTVFSELTAAIITSSFEGSCQHKTLIQNPLTSDGSFPTPGSNLTGMVEFLEYYSEQTNNIQHIPVDGFKFAIDPESLTTTSETCAINADMFVFYDMTSMDATTRSTAYNGFKAWHQAQVNNGYTGRVVHIQLYGERWVLWPAWILNPQDPSLTKNYDGTEWYGRQGGNNSHNQTANANFTIDDAMSGVDTHKNSTSNIRALTEWENDTNAILNADQQTLGKTIPTDPTDPAYNGIAPDANAIVVCFADESDGIPNQVDGIHSNISGTTEKGRYQRRGTYHHQTDTNTNSHVTDWYEAGLYYERTGPSTTYGGFGKNGNISLDLNNNYVEDNNQVGTKNTGTPEVTDLWKIDYIEATTRLSTHQGNIATFVYPARANPGKSHRAFPLHVIGAIESGPNNDGLLPVGDTKYTNCTAADLNEITKQNPYFTSGYGGLDQFGFAYNVTVVSTANATTFESIINNDLTQFLEESEVCDSFTETIFTDPNICLDENGNMLFHIDEFFMDPLVDTQPFTTYTDYITHAQNKGYQLTLADTRLESQIGGPIVADECICAEVCPNDLVLNDNTTIVVTGSSFEKSTHPFIQGDGIIQSNNPGFTGIIQNIDDVSNALTIQVTNGILNFTDPLISITTGVQYLPDSSVGEFIIPQPQGVFADYNEYMNFISDPNNGYTTASLNTLKFHLVDQSYQQVTVEQEDCSIEADIYVFYDHTSMGATARANAFNAINDWALDLQATQGFNKNVYHIKANDERWLRWGTAAMEGLNTNLALASYPIEPHLSTAENDPNVNVYSNTFASSNGNFSTVGVPTGDILVICYLDEANSGYVDSATDKLAPSFSSTEPKPTWQTDHTDYITAYNNYTSGNVACFFYPTPSVAFNSSGIYSATMLGALAGITSGDNNNGLLANPPVSDHGGYDSQNNLVTPGATTFNILQTENPYFTNGYGELDKYGWGTNVTYPIMSSQQLSTDLNEFVSNSEICETERVEQITVDILCTGSLSTDINQYGLFTVEGFYQNSLISQSTTTNQYSADPTFYTDWNSFLLQKIAEDGATGIDFLNNNGASISTFTTWNQLSASVALNGVSEIITSSTTIPGTPINVYDTQSQIFNNSAAGSNITGSATQQLDWLIDNGHGQNLNNYYFTNDTLDETLAPYNSCTGENLPAGGGVYCFVTDFTFTTIPGLTFSSAAGTYTSWHTFIDTLNSLNIVTTPGTSVTTFNQPCDVGINTGISGQTSQGFTYIHTFLAGNVNDVHNLYVNTYISDDATANVVGYYFEDTNPSNTFTNTCTPEAYRYGKNFQVDCDMNTHPTIPSSTLAANGYFGSIMQTGLTKSPTYDSYVQLIDALNSACNAQGDLDQFNYTDDPSTVATTINTLVNNHPRYEGQIVITNLDMYVETCTCSTTTTPPTSTQVDIFTYQDDTGDILRYFNVTSETPYSANFIVNFQAANCIDIPGEPTTVTTEETQSIAGAIPLYGQIDGGACVCVPDPTGGEPLDGDIEFESCICCPESSSIEIGCLIAGEVSSSRCECSADTFETVINFVSASSFDIIPSSSAKTVEFRIKPHRLDKPTYTSLEACCDQVVTIPTASHIFSLFNEHHPEVTPHLVLRPHTGSDVSSSDDFRNFGSLDLYKNGLIVGSTDIFPVYNGAFWNIFIGTKGESGSSSEVYFGAYQSNFLGHVTHLTASATFSEYERALSFGDTAYNLTNNILPAETAYFCGVPTNTNSVSGSVNTFEYSGSLQEIKYHTRDFLTHDTLVKHALDPFQYAGNTVSSSWENVHLRLPLGSNNKVDSASYNNNNLGIIQNFNPHPSFSLYESSSISSSITSQSFSEVYETHRHLTPDTVGISTTSEKVRIDSGSVDRSILSFDIKSETSTLDRQPLDYNDLGVFFSPQTEINEDIVYTLGAFRLDDFIGDPTHQSLADYPDLLELKTRYFKKYLNSYRQNFFDYIKLIQYIDHTLFKMVEQFVPAKANLKTGLLIEPHYLERQKFARQIPTFETLEKEAYIAPYLDLEGEVKHYEACINISDLNNENYFQWMGALTASDNLYMSQSKYASDECNPYITLYDNFDPLYGNFVDCIISKEYYYVSKPPQFFGDDPVNPGIDPDITINPVSPSKTSGVGISAGGSAFNAIRSFRAGNTSAVASLRSSVQATVTGSGTSNTGY